MRPDQKLVDAAIALVQSRYPEWQVWEGAAAMYTASGKILTSTYAESPNEGAGLCHETGAICEAHKLGERLTATVCVTRAEDGSFHILAPCGICQERLWFWGVDVAAAVPVEGQPQRWQTRTLDQLQPHYWRKPYLG